MQDYTKQYFEQSKVWKESMEVYQYNVLNDLMKLIPKDVKNILDVGCGNGLITNRLPQNIKVIGMDLSSEALQFVNRDKVLGDIKKIPFENDSFDLVMANDILEHLPIRERNTGLKELARVGSKYIVITVPFMEDLSSKVMQCEECGRYCHINHHRHSFNLGELQELLQPFGYNCLAQILSGDVWQSEPRDVAFLKRMLTPEYAKSNETVCPHCGSKSTTAGVRSNCLDFSLNKLESDMYASKEELVDLNALRTECISIYSKSSLDDYRQQNKGLFKKLLELDSFKYEELSNNYIDFSKSQLYKKEFLPLHSSLPYFICSNTSPEGVLLKCGKRLLMGYFCVPENEENAISLKISGMTLEPQNIYISSYTDKDGYNSPADIKVDKGDFEIEVEINTPYMSIYGILFEVKIDGEAITFYNSTLSKVKSVKSTVYRNPGEKFDYMRLPYSPNRHIYLSLALYGEYILDAKWMKDSRFLDKYTPPSSINKNFEQVPETFKNFVGILIEKLEAAQSDNDKLRMHYKELTEKYDELNSKCGTLNEKYNELNFKYGILIEKYNSLKTQNKQLLEQERTLLAENNLLIDDNKRISKELEAVTIRYNKTLGRRLKKIFQSKEE